MICRIQAPTEKTFEGEISSITLPTIEGQITVLAHHQPIITPLSAGAVKLKWDDQEEEFFISRGLAYITSDSVTLLVEDSMRGHDRGYEQAIEEAHQRARELAKSASDSRTTAYATAQLEKTLMFRRYMNRHSHHSHHPTIDSIS